MLPASGLISGWLPSPYDNDDDVDLHHMQFPSFEPSKLTDGCIPNSTISTPSSDSSLNYLSPLDTTTSSSVDSLDHYDQQMDTSRTDSCSASTVSSSDRRTARKRSVDPDYVPRPRNAFIIFRCEYAPAHKRGAPGAPGKGTPASQKTLSGRAGEVWRNMSEAERAVYKARAEHEKIEHAIRNPEYRFQPDRKRRRATTDAGLGRNSRPPALRKGRRDDSHVAWDSKALDSAVGGWKTESAPTILLGRRRSSSMPQPVSQPAPFLPPQALQPSLSQSSCVSSPSADWADVQATTYGDDDDLTPSTPSDVDASPYSASLHTPSSQMVPLRDSSLFRDFSFDSSFDMRSTQNPPAVSRPVAPDTYTHAEPAPQSFTVPPYANAIAQYPSPLELVSTSYSDWAQDSSAVPPSYATETYPAPAAGMDAPLGPSYLPTPFADQSTTITESATALWGQGYPANEDGMAMYMNALDNYSIPVDPADQDVPLAGYDQAAANAAVSFDDFFHAM